MANISPLFIITNAEVAYLYFYFINNLEMMHYLNKLSYINIRYSCLEEMNGSRC